MDTQAATQIEGFDGKPVDSLWVLGVWVDKKLRWTTHVRKVACKGAAQFEALSQITSSTWGPSFNKSRLLYTAVIRPTITYGSKIWATGEGGRPPPASLLQPLTKLQNRCLRRVTGAYKRAPARALEKDAAIEPLPLYIQSSAMRSALRSETHAAVQFTKQTCDKLWDRHQPRWGHRLRHSPTPTENLLEQAKAAAKDTTEAWKAESERRSRGQNRQ